VRARLIALAIVAACAFLPAGPAPAVVKVGEDTAERSAFDSRTGRLDPTAAQRELVRDMRARAQWNHFGTPSSIVRHGGYLDGSVAGSTAVAAARNWLGANRGLFRLSSIEGLELEADSRLRQSAGHAVSFRQTFGGLETSDGGLVTIGLTRGPAGWRVAYASSTITGDERIAGGAPGRRRPGGSASPATGRLRGRPLCDRGKLRGIRNFASPPHAGARATFGAIERGTGEAVQARVYVGHYEARVSPVADTDPATDAPAGSGTNNLDEFATFAPGTYEFVATAPGYGHVRFRQTLEGGTAPTVTIPFDPNLASAARGASATGDAAPVISPTSEPEGAVVLTARRCWAG
jgi:hypothetical protein